jgi:hypothetical protein
LYNCYPRLAYHLVLKLDVVASSFSNQAALRVGGVGDLVHEQWSMLDANPTFGALDQAFHQCLLVEVA